MKKIFLLILLSTIISNNIKSNEQEIILTFTANYACTYCELDSIVIENITQGGKKVLEFPDTVLTLTITGISDLLPQHFKVTQNYPNPFKSKTGFDINVKESDYFNISVYDLSGKTIVNHKEYLEYGLHNFTFYAGDSQNYILNIKSDSYSQQIFMVNVGNQSKASLSYNGLVHTTMNHKDSSNNLPFSLGDKFEFTGYATKGGIQDYDVINHNPAENTIYTFEIADEDPEQPSEISGETTVAPGSEGLIYEVDEMPNVWYSWSVPEGWEITDGQGTYSITVSSGMEPGNISVVAVNDCGESLPSILPVDIDDTFENPCEGFYDGVEYNGFTYSVIEVGSQCWFSENLRTDEYSDGTEISGNLSNSDWSSATEGAYAVQPFGGADGIDSEEEMIGAYGKLYNWFAVNDDKGLCPEGWIVPDEDDWSEMFDYIIDNYDGVSSGNLGNALKSCRQVGHPDSSCNTNEHPRWNHHNIQRGMDIVGFSAIPGGYRRSGGAFSDIGTNSDFWTSSISNEKSEAVFIAIDYDFGDIVVGNTGKNYGAAIRCIRDID